MVWLKHANNQEINALKNGACVLYSCSIWMCTRMVPGIILCFVLKQLSLIEHLQDPSLHIKKPALGWRWPSCIQTIYPVISRMLCNVAHLMMILVQTIPARSFPKQIGNKPITSAYFNNHSQILVVGCMDLSIFVPDLEKEELIKYVFTYLRGLNHKQE